VLHMPSMASEFYSGACCGAFWSWILLIIQGWN